MNQVSKSTTKRYLEALLHDEGNIDLYKRIKEFTIKNINFNRYEGVSKQEVIIVSVVKCLDDIVFETLQAVYMFHEEPFECISWIKGVLKKYDRKTSEFFQLLFVAGLNDRRRFTNYKSPSEPSHLKFIRKENNLGNNE